MAQVFATNPNNFVSAQVLLIQAKLSYLNETGGLQYLASGNNTAGAKIPGNGGGKRGSIYMFVNVTANVSLASGGARGEALAKKIGKVCRDASPKEPKKFKVRAVRGHWCRELAVQKA
jgi:hypothetical protein